MFLLYVLSGFLGAAAVLFSLQNPDPVAVSFLEWRSVSLPLSVVIMLAVFLGVVVTSISAWTQEIQLRQRISRLKVKIGELRRQVAEHSDVARLPRGISSGRAETAPRDPQHAPVTAEHGHRV
jgi:uncharacterized integral membrane protein